MNRYSYCYNNPLRYTDPTGHFGWDDISSAFSSTVTWAHQQVYNAVNTVTSFWNDIAPVAQPVIEAASWAVCIASVFVNPVPLESKIATAGATEQRIATAVANAEAKLPSLAGNVLPKLESTGVGAAEKVASKSLTPYYPPNGGALGAWEKATLSPGSTFSRIGDIRGHYVSPVGTSLEMRSLPPSKLKPRR